jgi:hypothetical protein
MNTNRTGDGEQVCFSLSIKDCIDTALSLIKLKLELCSDPEHKLVYHNSVHTGQYVIPRTERILRSIHEVMPEFVTERHIALGMLAAAWHDVVQEWDTTTVVDEENTCDLRAFRIGSNEEKSRECALLYMDLVNVRHYIFTVEDKQIVSEAFPVTIPTFIHGCVVQQYLTPKTGVVARAVALADLGSAGMDGASVYLEDGNKIFREVNIDIMRAVAENVPIPLDKQAWFEKRILLYSSCAIDFAKHRSNQFELEIDGLPDSAKEAVRKLFYHFYESIAVAKERLIMQRKMCFSDLMNSMGYNILEN